MLGLNSSNRSQGYSLIELIITITLTSIVMVIFYTVFSQNQVKSVSTIMQAKAAELGQAYLEEIGFKGYDENSPAGNAVRCNSGAPALPCSATLTSDGETRILYDDVDDYNGLIDSPPRDALDQVRTGFNGFSVSVIVSYAGTDFGFAQQDLKKIVVTVSPPASEGGQFVFTHYRGNF